MCVQIMYWECRRLGQTVHFFTFFSFQPTSAPHALVLPYREIGYVLEKRSNNHKKVLESRANFLLFTTQLTRSDVADSTRLPHKQVKTRDGLSERDLAPRLAEGRFKARRLFTGTAALSRLVAGDSSS